MTWTPGLTSWVHDVESDRFAASLVSSNSEQHCMQTQSQWKEMRSRLLTSANNSGVPIL
ncbi:hypothetical protein [Coleofasciculus sp. FACHB-1120]|uniref:hypothetical protein n=1 Tax=Coleofasciculus sp. FACHB-1120 TaxID=2692783 RepID=UPI0016840798|nr:hypothetical protein [Coleofasciculus sp. FACHB-1120]MBD2740616.1 hypothetical protein [Coleofasciculus sp. FACHB-1120]